MAPIVLRPNATHVHNSVVPLISKVSDRAVPTPPDEFLARFETEVPLRQHDADDILERIGTLTGEPPEALLRMALLDLKDKESAVRLAHFTIVAANEILVGQEISAEKAAGDAAVAAVKRLSPTEPGTPNGKDKQPPPTSKPDSAQPDSAQSGPSGESPKPKKRKRRVESSDSSGSEDEDLESDPVHKERQRLKDICKESDIHLHPMRLERALASLIRKAKKAGNKRIETWKLARELFVENATIPGVGTAVWKIIQTKEERRLAEEKEKATTALRGRQGTARQTPRGSGASNFGTWAPQYGPSATPPAQYPGGHGRGEWAPRQGEWAPSRSDWAPGRGGWAPGRSEWTPSGRGGTPQNISKAKCFNCNQRGHLSYDCHLPRRNR
ncbi:uncharacterized protein [Branchiostoma lanceolatum]|uniref:uncharacterized protein n=1 Tax=Branchiostoma lanceolatum TaxID=7740 RepID=UPI0034572F43